jgi:hypothetical protein
MRGNAGALGTAAHEGSMSEQEHRSTLSVQNETKSALCLAREQSIAPFFAMAAMALAITAQAFAAQAADDIQQIKLGSHVFYVPKAWMSGGPVMANSSQGSIMEPQPSPVEAANLTFRPTESWRPYGSNELPALVSLTYAPMTGRSILDQRYAKWLDEAVSRSVDNDGFVRVASALPLAEETFLYKGYLNEFGEPLIVQAHNGNYGLGNRSLSIVIIKARADIVLQYRFDNRKFPENTWWPLYQRVIAFIDDLQKPK